MFQPKPHKVVCKKCGWSKVIVPKSDVLSPMDFVYECPKCKNDDLERRAISPLNPIDNIIVMLKNR